MPTSKQRGVGVVVGRALTLGVNVVALAVLVGGCVSSSQLTPTQPSAITQQLVVRSLERALLQLDTTRFAGRKVSVDLFAQQSGTQAFVKEFVTAWLEARGVRVTSEGQELKLKIFASVLGSDRGETFLGIPSLQAPLIGIPSPEIALFKWVRNRGLAEVSIYEFDGAANTFVGAFGPGIGRSKQDDFTFLIVINFTLTDLDERPHANREGSDRH